MTLKERIRRVEERYPEYMTQRQLGEALDLSPSSTHKLLRDGVIPYRKGMRREAPVSRDPQG